MALTRCFLNANSTAPAAQPLTRMELWQSHSTTQKASANRSAIRLGSKHTPLIMLVRVNTGNKCKVRFLQALGKDVLQCSTFASHADCLHSWSLTKSDSKSWGVEETTSIDADLFEIFSASESVTYKQSDTVTSTITSNIPNTCSGEGYLYWAPSFTQYHGGFTDGGVSSTLRASSSTSLTDSPSAQPGRYLYPDKEWWLRRWLLPAILLKLRSFLVSFFWFGTRGLVHVILLPDKCFPTYQYLSLSCYSTTVWFMISWECLGIVLDFFIVR